MNTKTHALTPWQIIYTDPISLRPNEQVTVEDRDSEWPGWVWCTHPNGKTGWVPQSYLDRTGNTALARRDYTATELAVQPGDELTLLEYESGWYWAINAQGQSGWIPANTLQL